MKKNIIIGVLVVTNIMFLVFGFIQKQAADESLFVANQQRELAIQAQMKAKQAEGDALKQMQLAEQQVIIARNQAEKAAEALH